MLELLRSRFGLLWPRFTWKLFDWLANPPLVTLVLLIGAVVLALAVGSRYRRHCLRFCLALLTTYWLIISPLFWWPAIQLLVAAVPPDPGAPADVIVVLARSPEVEGDRYTTALALVENGRASQLLVMGRGQGQRVYRELRDRHLLTPALTSADCVRTTKQEAYAAAAALGNRGLSHIILITDAPHMLRAWLTFRGLGFTVTPHIEPLPRALTHPERSLLAIREYLGLVSYGVLGRFQHPPASELPQVAQAAADDFPRDRCFQTAEQIRQSLPES